MKNQKLQSDIYCETSTPNAYIKALCRKYNIPLIVNNGEPGITQDWNYAYSHVNADYVTIAHQDDVYKENYTQYVLSVLENAKRPIIFFSDYGELRDGVEVYNNKLLRIKRIMLLPLRISAFRKSKFVRRRILALGSPICCPSVTFVKCNCPEVIFQHGFRADEDWQAWELLSKCKGSFVYCTKKLMLHRIHGDSETSKILHDNARTNEDYEMFCKFWPGGIARVLTKIYGSSEKSNDL